MASMEFIGVPIHKDVTDYEYRVVGSLTGRQLVCWGIAGVLGAVITVVGIKFLAIPMSWLAYILVPVIGLPVLATTKPDGLRPEAYLGLMLAQYLAPQKLAYQQSSETLSTSFHGKRPPAETQSNE